jgi:glycosyltransferase involved in cell wall biosynthesis
MKLSVVIPIYNEEENIDSLINRLRTVVAQMQISCEYIFVNDGSKDHSFQLIKNLALADSAVKYIDFSRNFGHQIAVSAGLDLAAGDRVAIIDADLQDPPELIIEMFAKMDQGYEVVYAKRNNRNGESWLKKFTAKVFYRILKSITSVKIPVDTGDFRIIDRKVVNVLNQMPEHNKFLRGQISWIGFKQTYVEYNRNVRQAGSTGYTYKKMIRLALDGITSFSNFPLKVASICGFVVSGIAFIVMIYALYSRYITKDYVEGWTSTIISVLFLGGIQLISIGIIGEYISRLSENARNRPLYIINETNIKKEA